MPGTPATLPPRTPRLYDALPFSPVATGLGVFSALVAVYLVWAYAAVAWLGLETTRAPLLAELWRAALIAYLPAACVYTTRGSVGDLQALEPALETGGGTHTERMSQLLAPHGASLLGISAGLGLVAMALSLVGVLGVEAPEELLVVGFGRPASDPLLAWSALCNGALAYVLAQLAYVDIALARRIGDLGKEARVDLLDLSPLRPFARRGVRSLLLWIPPMVLSFVLGLTPLAALFVAVRPAHRRIRERKRVVLAGVVESIRREAKGLAEAGAGTGAAGRLADLIAYESRVAGVLPWLLDGPAIVRLVAYLLVAAASWSLRR